MPPEQEMAVDVQEASVDCPICQGSFPASQIEMHAAYCDGTPVDSHRRREGGDSIPGKGPRLRPAVIFAA